MLPQIAVASMGAITQSSRSELGVTAKPGSDRSRFRWHIIQKRLRLETPSISEAIGILGSDDHIDCATPADPSLFGRLICYAKAITIARERGSVEKLRLDGEEITSEDLEAPAFIVQPVRHLPNDQLEPRSTKRALEIFRPVIP